MPAAHVLVAGCGGRKLSDVEHDQPEWLQYAAKEWGYGRVTVRDGRDLTFEFVLSESGEVADSVRLHNSRSQRRHCDSIFFQQEEAYAPEGHLRMPGHEGGNGTLS